MKQLSNAYPPLLCGLPLWQVEEDDLCAKCAPPRLRKCYKQWCAYYHISANGVIRKKNKMGLKKEQEKWKVKHMSSATSAIVYLIISCV